MKNTFKDKSLLISFVACCLLFCLSSCTRITDAQITAFEKSINKLEKNYKDLTPSQLEKAVDLCNDQIDRLEEKELTINQKKRFRSLKFQYGKLLVKIRIYSSLSEVYKSEKGQSVLEYLNEVIDSADANVKELLGE